MKKGTLLAISAVVIVSFIAYKATGSLWVSFSGEEPKSITIFQDASKTKTISHTFGLVIPFEYGHYSIAVSYPDTALNIKLCHQNSRQKEIINISKRSKKIVVTHNYSNDNKPIEVNVSNKKHNLTLGVCG